MNEARFPQGFSAKNIFWLQQPILGLKMVCSCNFRSTLGIFFEILRRVTWKIYECFFGENSHLEQMGHFLARKWCVLTTLDRL